MDFDFKGTIDKLYKYTKQFVNFDEEEGQQPKTRASIHLHGSIDLEKLLEQTFDQEVAAKASSSRLPTREPH